MKKLSLLVLTGVICCLIGCENPELVTCRQDNQTLQTKVDDLQVKLDKANDSIIKKNEKIEDMKAKDVEMQTKAMQSIQTMMMKQGERDIQKKIQIEGLQKQVESLQEQVKKLEADLKKEKAKTTDQ